MVFMILCFVVCVQFPYTPSNSLTICRQVNSSQRTRLASAVVDNVAPGDVKTDAAHRIIAGARRLRPASRALLLNQHHKPAGGNHHIETTLIGGNNCSQITNVLPTIDSSIAVEDLFPPSVGNGQQILLN